MAIVLNNRKSAAKTSRRHPAVVPAAAVWDPRAPHPTPGSRNRYGAGIRTLRIEQNALNRGDTLAAARPTKAVAFVRRTTPFENVAVSPAELEPHSARQSILGTWLVGILFGLVLVGGIFGGAELAGDNSPINGYSAGSGSLSTASVAQ